MTLSQLAARQFGVVSAGQLLRLGWTWKEIQGQVRRGSLHPLYREVYAVGHDRIVDHGRLLAALLSCGDGSFLSHRTAAAVWGLRPVNTRRVELTVPGINAPHRRGLVVHRSTDVAKDEGRSRNGLRVSSVPRMLIELANSELQAELERLITEAVRRRLIDFPLWTGPFTSTSAGPEWPGARAGAHAAPLGPTAGRPTAGARRGKPRA